MNGRRRGQILEVSGESHSASRRTEDKRHTLLCTCSKETLEDEKIASMLGLFFVLASVVAQQPQFGPFQPGFGPPPGSILKDKILS